METCPACRRQFPDGALLNVVMEEDGGIANRLLCRDCAVRATQGLHALEVRPPRAGARPAGDRTPVRLPGLGRRPGGSPLGLLTGYIVAVFGALFVVAMPFAEMGPGPESVIGKLVAYGLLLLLVPGMLIIGLYLIWRHHPTLAGRVRSRRRPPKGVS